MAPKSYLTAYCKDNHCQQLKPKGTRGSLATTVIAVTILVILSILFSRVTVDVLVFVLRVVFLVHLRCLASELCIVSKFCVKSVLLSVR